MKKSIWLVLCLSLVLLFPEAAVAAESSSIDLDAETADKPEVKLSCGKIPYGKERRRNKACKGFKSHSLNIKLTDIPKRFTVNNGVLKDGNIENCQDVFMSVMFHDFDVDITDKKYAVKDDIGIWTIPVLIKSACNFMDTVSDVSFNPKGSSASIYKESFLRTYKNWKNGIVTNSGMEHKGLKNTDLMQAMPKFGKAYLKLAEEAYNSHTAILETKKAKEDADKKAKEDAAEQEWKAKSSAQIEKWNHTGIPEDFLLAELFIRSGIGHMSTGLTVADFLDRLKGDVEASVDTYAVIKQSISTGMLSSRKFVYTLGVASGQVVFAGIKVDGVEKEPRDFARIIQKITPTILK